MEPSADVVARPSRIERVELFRKGAEVVRVVSLEGSESRVRIDELPLELDDASVRVEVQRGRVVVGSVRVAVESTLRSAPASTAESAELQAVRRRLRAIALELEELRIRLERASALALPERPPHERGQAPLAAPDRARLELLHLRHRWMSEARARARALERERRGLERTARSLEEKLAARGAAAADRVRTFKSAIVELERTDPMGAALALRYRVSSARWAPSYRLSFDPATGRARLAMRAMVAQRTGEDWRGVALAVSTARMDAWYDLPELLALRIGRVQPAPRSGFRPLPTDGRDLFADHDRDLGAAARTWTSGPGSFAPSQPAPRAGVAPLSTSRSAATASAANDTQDEMTRHPQAGAGSGLAFAAAPWMDGAAFAVPAAAAPPPTAAAAPAAAPSPTAAAVPAAAPPPMAYLGEATRESSEDALEISPAPDEAHPGVDSTAMPGPGWFRYAALRLEPPSSPFRGRLRFSDPDGERESLLAAVLEARDAPFDVPVPPRHKYPSALFGFDHRYAAEALADVPSLGVFHAVAILEVETPASMTHVTVPREDPSVYRTLALAAPFSLLAGPVDVLLGGELVVSGEIEPTPAGGPLVLGLGVDETVRVARRVRFHESSAGLLGGSSQLVHEVEVEVRNNGSLPVRVEVRERLPVPAPGQEDVEVRLLRVQPSWEEHAQDDPPLEGGRRWIVDLAPGEVTTLGAEYAIRIPAKYELIGGNRRD